MGAIDIDIVAERLTPAVETAVAMATTLLLRLDRAAPRIHLDLPTGRTTALPRLGDGSLPDELAREHAGFSSVDRFTPGRSDEPTLRLVFDGDAAGVKIDTAGWACAVGASLQDVPGNPISAAFAGVLASAEALKVALRSTGTQTRIKEWRGAVSLWDYSMTASAGPSLPDVVDLAGTAIVGCGGVASATAWTLSLLRLAGRPLAVDHDVLDDTNLNRHLTGSLRNVEAGKAELVAALLRRAGAMPIVEVNRWDALDQAMRSGIALGVISVDDDAARRTFQLDLPLRVLNGGTSDDGIYQVTSHDFVTEACLGCIARSDLHSSGPEESVARRLGIPIAELRPYLGSDTALTVELLKQLAAEDRALVEGVPGRELGRIACGHLRTLPGEPALSAPMLSAAPGILLAGEIVKDRMSAPAPLSPAANRVATNILTGPHERWLSLQHKRAACECQDDVYRNFYRARWRDTPRPPDAS